MVNELRLRDNPAAMAGRACGLPKAALRNRGSTRKTFRLADGTERLAPDPKAPIPGDR
jgi:hypothetical protein